MKHISKLPLNVILISVLAFSTKVTASSLLSSCDIDTRVQCQSVKSYLQQAFIAESGFATIKACKRVKQRVYGLQKQCEYDQYLAKANQAMTDYKAKVLSVWGEAKVTSQHNWVTYNKDLSQRSDINYQSGTIDISIIGEHSDDKFIRIAEEEMLKTLNLTQEEAEKADPFLSSISNSTPKISKSLLSAKGKLKQVKMLPIGDSTKEITQLIRTGKIKRVKEKKTQIDSTKVTLPSKTTLTVKFPNNWVFKRASQLKPMFEENTGQWQLETALGLAMMYTESSFNPLARSTIPAYGLMQVVPTSAGIDVNDLLFSKQTAPTPQQLYIEQTNVKFGGGYLKLLRDRYFKKIKNPLSKKYCMIAAYNTGPGNVAKAFTGRIKLKAAINKINKLTPEEVHITLLQKLPYEETRKYLKKVLKEEVRFSQI